MASNTSLLVEIDGTEVAADDLNALIDLQVEEAADTADALTLVARLEAGADGEWTSLLDPLTAARTPIVAQLSRNGVAYRFDGRSTEASWQINASGASQLTIKAIDRSLELDNEEKIVAWPGQSDSTIASAILSSYGMRPDVEDTPAGPDSDVHVVLQRGTDWAFFRALAAKWGYAAYLEGDGGTVTGHFHPLDPLADPQGELALGFGADAGQVAIVAQLHGGRRVQAARIPTLSDAAQNADVAGDDQPQGRVSLGAQTTVLLSPTDIFGEIEPEAASTGLARQSAFGVTLTTTVESDNTPLLVRARRTILITGLGSALSGRYLVQRVRHQVTLDSHRQSLTLVRNAVGLKGDEPFGEGDLLGGLL